LTNTLITLAFSHYNEKARWALDWCGVPYRERRYLPGFSQLAVFAATRGHGGRADKVSSKLSTPVLLLADGTALHDSTDIARYASATLARDAPGPLFADPEVATWVDRFGTELGPYTRLSAYYHALRAPDAMSHLASANVGAAQALAFRALAPLGKRWLATKLRITPERADQARARVERELDHVEAHLRGRRYLVGDAFTAADLTFAALMAPVLLVTRAEGYGASFPDAAELMPDARELVTDFRARPAGQFVLGIYARHRRERGATPR
jgi:glutathione S-transferase